MKKLILILCFVMFGAVTMFSQTFTELKAAAEKGDAEAMVELSSRYAGIDDYTNAFFWLQKSAEAGNARAYTDLAQIYFEGMWGQPVNECKGYDCILKAAKISDAPDLQLIAGHLYMVDEKNLKELGCTNIKRDLNEAENYLLKAVAAFPDEEVPEQVKIALGDIYFERKNYAEAAKWYDIDDFNAQNKLGWMYENGFGVPKDTKKAIELYRKAAEQGNEEANDRHEKLTGKRVKTLFEKDEEKGKSYELNGKGAEYYNQGNYAEAVKWFKQAAEQDNMYAQCNLGVCYANGQGVPQDDKEAFKWYKKSAEQGYDDAQLKLGFLYESTKEDYVEAAKWYRKAAEQGNMYAQYNLGIYYSNGRQGVPQDDKEAFKWYKMSAEQGYDNAQLSLGFLYENIEEDYTEAAKWYRKAAEQGNVTAQSNLGWCYQNGKGVERNLTEALNWFLKAAEQDNARAQYNAGLIYHFRKNYAEAEKWYKAAAEDDFYDVYYRLGRLYDDKEDYVEAFKWYTKAAEEDDAAAQTKLGWCYKNGMGVKQNLIEAAKWYRKAAEQDNATAQTNLGELLLEGEDGVKQDFKEALKWLKKSAEQNESFAMRDLGSIYKMGYGVPKDDVEAAKWYRKSAELGNNDGMIFLAELILYDAVKGDYAEAVKWLKKVEANDYKWSYGQYLTGMAYEEGKGVQANKQEAIKWYSKAAEQGHEEAKERLVRLNSQSLEGCAFETENGVLQFVFKANNKAEMWEKGDPKPMFNNDYWYNATTQKGEFGGLPFTISGNKLTMTALEKKMVFIQTKGKIPPKPADNLLEGCVFELNMLVLTFKANNKFEMRAGSGIYTYNTATQSGELNFTNTIVGELQFTETFKISGNKLTMTNMDKVHTLTLTKGKIPK